jgi:hypothetical protein
MLIPPQIPTTPSPRTRALADRLRATIAEFQRREPKVTSEEVAHALRELQPNAARPGAPPLAVIATVLIALGAAMAFGLVADRGGEPAPARLIAVAVLAAVLAIVVLVVRLRTRR